MHKAKLKLICVPYAGGPSSIFDRWNQFLGPAVDLVKFEYPGRGHRIGDKSSTDLDQLVSEVVSLVNQIDGPYVLFGHSMGAIITYLVALSASKKPDHLFFSAFEPPHKYFSTRREMHKLPNKQFIEALKEIGCLPGVFLKNPKVLNLYLPAIRHDFFILESYKYDLHNVSLGCKTSVFLGIRDSITFGTTIEEWQKCSSAECRVYEFDGNHFFIDNCNWQVVSTINRILKYNDLV